MIVVSDTSPVLNLARVRRLDLLPSLYHQVFIPPAVSTELGSRNSQTSQFIHAALGSWLLVASPENHELVAKLRNNLDAGEAEAIVLAVERQASLLLLDERLGRRAARTFGLRITGLIGVLVDTKQARLIDQVKPVLDELIAEAHFWIGTALYQEILAKLDET